MIKIRATIIITFFCLNLVAQNSNTLSKKLWAQVQNCYEVLQDTDNNKQSNYDELIDDSKNGYLKISGSFPTCGCNCINTVGAYKTAKNNSYVLIKKSNWGCSWKKEITTSKTISKVFPIDFETDGFFAKKLDTKAKNATFYIDIEIPRTGTDTKVTIKPIPFGLHVKSNSHIVFSHSQENGISDNQEFYYKAQIIVQKAKNKQTLEYILNNQFEKIESIDKKLVNKLIKSNEKKKLITTLQELQQIYNLYLQIKHESLLLGWNRTKESFYIKEKGENPKKISFIEFLKTKQFWGAIC